MKLGFEHFAHITLQVLNFGEGEGTYFFFETFFTILTLWNLFWPNTLLQQIMKETNCYATQVLDIIESTMGGPNWIPLTIPNLKAILAITKYMYMKKQPNINSYLEKCGSLFHCPIISNIKARDRFFALP